MNRRRFLLSAVFHFTAENFCSDIWVLGLSLVIFVINLTSHILQKSFQDVYTLKAVDEPCVLRIAFLQLIIFI